MTDNATSTRLTRQLGTFGAVMMGLGSIMGTGVFVSIGIAAGVAGSTVVIAVAIGALVATFNGLSSAQLAANHPVSGGTYEYGYRFLKPVYGFTAGWMFLIAKSASAATAALGFSGYLLGMIGLDIDRWLVPVALIGVIGLTVVVFTGVRRSNVTNIVIVSITLLTLVLFVLTGSPTALQDGASNFAGLFDLQGEGNGIRSLLYASALMFVAYTGYGRIATLGEEVRSPRTTIPRAIIATLITTMVIYIAVAVVSVGAVGADTLAAATDDQAAPLEVVARAFNVPGISHVVAFGAITAMLGVLLNLILGLSRVLLAMGRRADMPTIFGRIDASGTTPGPAVLMMGGFVAALTLIGDVGTTWTFSAFTVLIYYAITNWAALYIPAEGRLFPKWISIAGLIACTSLAFFVEPLYWGVGLGLLALGLAWYQVARRRRER
ncbi:MAG: APC family permease [Rhodothermaceae bacterium]|nr:APC family permease [Rhodothermaceae bacterium]